jgi:replicative DNA helicase
VTTKHRSGGRASKPAASAGRRPTAEVIAEVDMLRRLILQAFDLAIQSGDPKEFTDLLRATSSATAQLARLLEYQRKKGQGTTELEQALNDVLEEINAEYDKPKSAPEGRTPDDPNQP